MKYHKPADIQFDINSLIDRLEDNQQVFANQLAEHEQYTPHFHYQTEFQKLRSAIATLKEVRNLIGSIDWIGEKK
ncbi:MAG: hypothetical protein ACRC2R_17880 [Xenococcaceae cyanobacterium]